MRSGLVHNGGAVPPGVAASVVLCLGKGVCRNKDGEKKGRRNLATMLHKVSDAVGGKIKSGCFIQNSSLPDSCQDVSFLTALQ
jgi:hypothetical protein